MMIKKHSPSVFVSLAGRKNFNSKTLKLKKYLFLASLGAFQFGAMLSWSAPIAEQMIDNPEYKFRVTSEMFGWVAGIMALGGVFSCLISGYFRNIFGTKVTLIVFNLPIIVGHVLIIFASNFMMVNLISRLIEILSICTIVIKINFSFS